MVMGRGEGTELSEDKWKKKIYDANSKQNKSMLSGASSIKLVGVKHQLNKITPQHFNQKRRVLYGGRVSSTCMPGDQ